jgi:enamine deaminase RidA (YjgF/YER057c/UK114 family)
VPEIDRFPRPVRLGEPLGLYSHVAQLSSPRKLVLVAGQVSVDGDGEVVAEGNFEAQFRRVFENLAGALEAVELGLHDVLKFTTYLTSADLIEPFYAVRESLFATLYPAGEYPGNTLLVVSRLVRPEFLIEIEAIAGR